MKLHIRLIAIAGLTVVLVVALTLYIWHEEHRPPILEIYVFNMQSGRSMFIRTPEDNRILIDGGGNSDIIRDLTDILPFYSRRIDVVMTTNTDGKNVAGLIDVVSRYHVRRAYIPAVTLQGLGLASSTDQIYATFLETLSREKIPVEEIRKDYQIALDTKVNLTVLFPTTDSTFIYSKASAPELLFKINYDASSVVFIGDASIKVQKFLSSTTKIADVLLSDQSALPINYAQSLIEELQPAYLIYSAKSFPHSKKKIIDPLIGIAEKNRFNIKKGTVRITSDGQTLRVEQF